MSYFHKAHAFSWSHFEAELAPILAQSLVADDRAPLLAFVAANESRCRDLTYGEPLVKGWRDALTAGDVQEAADIAITAYYDLNDDFGLGDAWSELERSVPPTVRAALLGAPFGPASRPFDPGLMGSYFQSELEARRSLSVLQRYCNPVLAALAFRRSGPDELREFSHGFRRAVHSGLGIYVTF